MATVTVASAVPILPNTGYTPTVMNLLWTMLATAFSGLSLIFVLRTAKQI
jgi:hypothetical protein